MNLHDLRALIRASSATDWEQISAPLFGRDVLGDVSSANHGRHIETWGHYSQATYVPDISISIAWGMDASPGSLFEETWVEQFPDKTARSGYLDTFYNGALVDRALYVSVDGGRANLPIPQVDLGEDAFGTKSKVEGYWIHRHDYELFDAFHRIVGTSGDFDRFVRQAGFEVR